MRGRVHSLIVLNIGFEPELQANQVRKIASALSVRMRSRGQATLFDTWSEGLSDAERAKAVEYWHRMVREQTLDRFDRLEG